MEQFCEICPACLWDTKINRSHSLSQKKSNYFYRPKAHRQQKPPSDSKLLQKLMVWNLFNFYIDLEVTSEVSKASEVTSKSILNNFRSNFESPGGFSGLVPKLMFQIAKLTWSGVLRFLKLPTWHKKILFPIPILSEWLV